MTTYPKRRLFAVLFAAAAALAPPEAGSDLDPAAAASRPGESHRALESLAGDYDLVSTFWSAPGAEPEISRLPASRRVILGGRALRLDVGPDAGGFVGTGLMGHDNQTGRTWYVWTDTSTTGLSLLDGTVDARGAGTLEGETPTPFGRSPLRVEIRHEGDVEIHDYYLPHPGGEAAFRMLELRYRRLSSS